MKFPEASFYNGSFTASPAGVARALIDPATAAECGAVFDATASEIETAISGAQAAFENGWRDTPPGVRSELLYRIADLVEQQAEAFAWADCRSLGKPISAARGEARYAAAIFRYYAGALKTFFGNTIPVASGGFDFTLRQPFGVVAAIVPWNFPLPIAAWKAAPALAVGNSVVLKPAESTPWSALMLGRAAHEAGLPPGALQVVTGDGTAGEALVAHPLVRKISFTGSTEVGRAIMRRAAGDLKRVSLELGGKSANLVFADCDLEAAAESAPKSVFDNTGQDCCARSRILVERTVCDAFLERFLAVAGRLIVGDPKEEKTELGPLALRSQFERVTEIVEAARAAGRRVLSIGPRPPGPGFFFEPTVILDCEPDDPWWREEIFGPVVCVRAFDSEEAAVREANDSAYGLSASLWTRDLSRALRVAKRLEAGVLSINSHSSVHLEAPFGGMKQSGIGRDLGVSALEEFTETRNVYIAV